MRVWLVLVMCVAAQASCPGGCTCRETRVSCPRGLPSPEQLQPTTTHLTISHTPTLPDRLANLQQLSLADCKISDLDNVTFDRFERLKTLDLSRNLITELSDETSFNQTGLLALDVSHNLIRTIRGSPFRTLCSLEVLNLSGNAIDFIPPDSLCGLGALLTLDLSGNNLTEVKNDSFDRLPSLQQLNLSKNQIVTLSENGFSNLQRLQQLDLSWNKLTYMSPGTLQALPSLSRLMIAGNMALGGGNKDSALLVGSGKRLQTLDASRTGLEHVPAALTHSVRTLRLAANSIRFVECGDLDSYPLLQLLDLTSNLIEEMEEDALGRLEMLVLLYLTDNKLHAIPRSLPDGLKILHLEFNRIEQIVSGDLLDLPKLEVLLLNDNNIKVVQEGAFTQMTSLITLDLSRNPISILPAGTLAGSSRLQVLRLSSLTVDPPTEDGSFPVPSPEHLVRLDLSQSPGLTRQLLSDKAALAAFRELQELNLTNTDLVNLRSDLLHFMPQLRDLHITGNRLNCSGLLWLTLWMRVQDQQEHRQVICFSPPELYGTPLVDLQDNDMEITTELPTTTATTQSIELLNTLKTTTFNYATEIDAKLESIFNNITENETDISNVSESKNTNKTLREKKNETAGASSVEIAASASPVTAASQNRSDTPDATTDRVHLSSIGIESPTETTVTDGHIAEINPTDNLPTSEPSNYTIREEQSTSAAAKRDESERATAPTTDEHKRVTASAYPRYANEADNLTLNKPGWGDDELSTVPERDVKTETGDNATGQMSMYSSRREVEANDEERRVLHPGMLILLAAIGGAALVLSTLISHLRKRRKRLNEDVNEYSRQQDIEVNSLPGFSELW